MKPKSFFLFFTLASFFSFQMNAAHTFLDEGRFNIEKDLLLAQFDCKTDVDDLHTVAALATLLADPRYSELQYHAVAGTYGVQKGLYVPPNDLFQLAFGDNWTDAHENVEAAVNQVKAKVKATLAEEGNIWIAEAGQSDFTAALIKAIQADLPELNIAQRIHVVQHSDWNEKSTSEESLQFVKENTEYNKISDGNAIENGTPGFRTAESIPWNVTVTDPQLNAIWELAIALSKTYNGKDERYNNKAIAAGGLDFSDLSEVCWILGLEDIKDATEFFSLFAR
ncbi:hypothetical protein FGM00_02785 [Aggregatimonas sangjinii]|uniref:DUF2181 domain-containing protein n=1 Tax=Aggregatimonas sangjinii TaxID=2583587 RepID=A0A5B7SR29_9FLAO|nr:hypothetical protein [Aggregatimonas sangjinii]QCW99093.1 hypothetical protein FGM00_02785 [Aggregatimonas sangjinii]